MEMNKNVVGGKWLEIKGEIQKAWGKLTNDELEETKGDMKSIGGLIQQRYGEAEGAYDEKIKNIFLKFESAKDSAMDEAKEQLRH
jgi:uncharacterized protein YjbJ (UPF0337 family)